MPDDPRVQQLLDELIDSQATPEEVCGSCPELLPQVRERWREICRAQAELDALFPPMTGPNPTLPAPPSGEIPLPVIPGYEVQAVLGVGGMGVVFRARDLRLGRIIALKMALTGAYAGPRERERFQREAEAVAGLCHANIVQIHEVGDHQGQPYFTMEFVDGGSLAQKLAAAPQSVRWAAELVATLAEAVSVAHRAGIVHRDLKPGNILLTTEGTPKISDFGLARRLKREGDLTWTGTTVGTPSYMAPEQASNTTGPVGPATDVYGLGAILYEMLTGRPPFCAESPLETVRQVLSEEPAPPSRLNPQVPRDLETICLKCLRKEPQRRYTSAAALAEDLRRYLLGQVVEARPVGPLERAGKWMRRNQWVASLSAAAVLALVAGTVVSLLFAFEARQQESLAIDRAGELERQAIELKAQTRIATENAKRARDKEDEVRGILIASLMMPIEGNAHPFNSRLDNTEVVGLCQLRKAPREIRLQFLDTVLRDPDAARRVGRRADWVLQVIVGCDRSLRDQVGQLLVERVQKEGTAQAAILACARLGQAANLHERVWAERSADALSAALCDKGLAREDCPALAASLAAVIEHLPRAQAAEHAARVTEVLLSRLQEPIGLLLGSNYFGRAIEAVSPYLEVEEANRTAETLGGIFHRSESIATAWESLAKAQLAVCQRLPPSDSAAHLNSMVDTVLEWRTTTQDRDKVRCIYHAQTLGTLSGQFDAKAAARVADTLIAILGDGYVVGGDLRTEFIESPPIAEALARVAERLDAAGGLRAAEGLIPVLKKADKVRWNMEPLTRALVGVCRRLDADGSRRVADLIAANFQDPKAPVLDRVLLTQAFVVVSGKLEPDKAAPLEGAIVDALVADLADAKMPAAVWQAQALGSVCGRPGTKCASRTAEALAAALRDPQTPVALLKPLAAALAEVSGRLPVEQASSFASKAAEALDALWIAKTNHGERALLAQATAAVSTHLGPLEAAAQARRMADDLGAAFQDPKAESYELKGLAEALRAVCGRLDPAEREAHLSSAGDIVMARFGKPKTPDWPSALLTEPLMTLWLGLDRDGLARAVDTLCTALADPEGQRYWLDLHVKEFKKVAARLDNKDIARLLDQPLTAGAVQRAILDVLGESKNRYFRNTWDYLDWTRSKGN
jgi:hypothetical protein